MRVAGGARGVDRPRGVRNPTGGWVVSSVGRRMVWAVGSDRQARPPSTTGHPRRAIASISTLKPFGSAATWTVVRAGGGSGKKPA